MKKETAKFLVQALDELIMEGYEVQIRSDYSGRGACGETTHAVVTDAGLGKILHAVMERLHHYGSPEGMDAILEDLERGLAEDNMGRSAMVYY